MAPGLAVRLLIPLSWLCPLLGSALALCAAGLAVAAAALPRTAGSPAGDRAVLEEFYRENGGADWRENAGWLTDAPLSEWHGVEVDANERVVSLRLGFNRLRGTLPAKLARLDSLRLIDFAGNDLAGAIPPEFGEFRRLHELNLDNNDIWGAIPDGFASLPELRNISLNGTYLDGPFPPVLRRMKNLAVLRLAESQFSGVLPAWLGEMTNLSVLELQGNRFSGPVPDGLRNLVRLGILDLSRNDFSGVLPSGVGLLTDLRHFRVGWNWRLSGRFEVTPAMLDNPWSGVDTLASGVCIEPPSSGFPRALSFRGGVCGAPQGSAAVDVLVVYTPAARGRAGGVEAIQSLIDLWVAETNTAYADSGVRHRIRLVDRYELVGYDEEDAGDHLERLRNPDDGYLDEVHDRRDEVGADLVHLLLSDHRDYCGAALDVGSVFAVTVLGCGALTFAHELGHNMGLHHDRFQDAVSGRGGRAAHPAYGYVHLAPPERYPGFYTIMSYSRRCNVERVPCTSLMSFSNPRLLHAGVPGGIPYGEGSGFDGAADSAAVLDVTMPAVAAWRGDGEVLDPGDPNRSPRPTSPFPNLAVDPGSGFRFDLARHFEDPDGDPLFFSASSSDPDVLTVALGGGVLAISARASGRAVVVVEAADPGGLTASVSFAVVVAGLAFTDDPLVPGVTPIKAVHFMELRERIDAVRRRVGLGATAWTDHPIRPGETSVRFVHLIELRGALDEVARAAGRREMNWSAAAAAGSIRAAHVAELRSAVKAAETGG